MQLDLEMTLRLIERLGIPIVLVIAFINGWIVPRYAYLQLKESETQFRQIALRNAELASRATEAVAQERKP